MARRISKPAAAAGTIDLGGDLTVNRMGYGAMRILGDNSYGEPPSRDEARATVRRAVELGVNFIDTADSYGPNISEEIICEALHPYPDDLVIATKGGRTRTGTETGGWPTDGRPEHLRKACEGSLLRLGLDQIPLYYLHHPDDKVPFEESVGALVELKDEGKIRHIGLSNVDEDLIRRAQRLTPIVAIQNRYNVDDRQSESLIDLCEQEQMIFVPWAPTIDLGGDSVVPAMARRYQITSRQLVLAWLLARSPAIAPIPGTGSVPHVEENVTAATVKLSDADVATLTESL